MEGLKRVKELSLLLIFLSNLLSEHLPTIDLKAGAILHQLTLRGQELDLAF